MFPRTNRYNPCPIRNRLSTGRRDTNRFDKYDIPSDESDSDYPVARVRTNATRRHGRVRVTPKTLEFEEHMRRMCANFGNNTSVIDPNETTRSQEGSSQSQNYHTPNGHMSPIIVEEEHDPEIFVNPIFKRWTVFGIQRPSWDHHMKCFHESQTSCEAFKDLVLETIKLQFESSKDQSLVFNKYKKHCKLIRVMDIIKDEENNITQIIGLYCNTKGVPYHLADTIIVLKLDPSEVGVILTPLISPNDAIVMLNYTKTVACSESTEHDYICIHITSQVKHKELPSQQFWPLINYNINSVIVDSSTETDKDFYIFQYKPRVLHLRSLSAAFPTVNPENYSSPSVPSNYTMDK